MFYLDDLSNYRSSNYMGSTVLQNFGQLDQQVTYVRYFYNFKCVPHMFILSIISFSERALLALINTSINLTCGTMIIKMKNSILACLIVSRVFIYASNDVPLCSTPIIKLGKNSICACYCKQIKTSFARIK